MTTSTQPEMIICDYCGTRRAVYGNFCSDMCRFSMEVQRSGAAVRLGEYETEEELRRCDSREELITYVVPRIASGKIACWMFDEGLMFDGIDYPITIISRVAIGYEGEKPILPAYATKDGIHSRVWCPFCQTWHSHGIGDGIRVAHCHIVDSPFSLRSGSPHYTGGYILRQVGMFKRAWLRNNRSDYLCPQCFSFISRAFEEPCPKCGRLRPPLRKVSPDGITKVTREGLLIQ